MKKINIIFFNMSSYSDWEKGIQNRNYHIVHTLHKRKEVNKIICVDFIPFNFKQKIKRFFIDILPNYFSKNTLLKSGLSTCYKNENGIYIYSTLNCNNIVNDLNKIQKLLNIKNSVIWSYNPMSIAFLNKNLSHSSIIFDTVDNWLEHNAYQDVLYQSQLQKNYEKIAHDANIIFTVSPNLNTWYKSNFNRSESVKFLANGIDSKYYSIKNVFNTKPIDFFEQENIKGKIILGYIGTMQGNRFDFDLIAKVAKNNPDKIIALCGPIWADSLKEIKQKLEIYKNIYFLGSIPRNKWLDYCSYFDIALNPHKVNEFTHYTSPTKIFEYLAAGKPVISTAACGTDLFKDEIEIAKNYFEFNNAINKILSQDALKNVELKKKKINQANKDFSWDKRVDSMFETITHHTSLIDN